MVKKREIVKKSTKKEEKIISKINRSVGLFLITIGTIILILLAWFLIIVGIAGLILPIIPGIVLIVLGIYILRSKRVRRYSMKIMRKLRKK